MSMLAERRRKKKWVLLPKRAPDRPLWTTESEGLQFGQKLMEKMGWSAGKGLGAQEQGIQEPLRVSYKNDTKGMGYKMNDSEWIEQQEEFNDLLNQLSGGGGQPEAVTEPSQQLQIKSLEEKSKKSRSRVHYKKFTRGKDLSRYSENDLACILGTNKPKPPVENSTEKEKCPENDKEEATFGVKTIHGGSIADYFSNKWAELKKTRKVPGILSDSNYEINEINHDNDDCNGAVLPEEPLYKVEKTKKRKHSAGGEVNEQNGNVNNEEEKTVDEVGVSKKKAKHKLEMRVSSCAKKETEHESDTVENFSEISLKIENALPVSGNDMCANHSKKKKDKSEKGKVCENDEVHIETAGTVENTQTELSKKKKKRKREAEEKLEEQQQEMVDETSEVLQLKSEEEIEIGVKKDKKKKKKKNSQKPVDDEHSLVQDPEGFLLGETGEVHPGKKDKSYKKHKKGELESSEELQGCIILSEMNDKSSEVNQQESKKKKKDKKKKKEETIECSDKDNKLQSSEKTENNQSNSEEEESKAKEKKKKKRKKEKSNPILDAEEENNHSEMNGGEDIEKEVKEVKKKKGEKSKEKVEGSECRDMGNAAEVDGEMTKTKKSKKHESENSHASTCEIIGDQHTEEISKQSSKQNDLNFDKNKDKMKDNSTKIIYTHKVANMKKKILPSVDQFSNLTNDKALQLYCGAELTQFKGSNLANLEGYGKVMRRTDALATK